MGLSPNALGLWLREEQKTQMRYWQLDLMRGVSIFAMAAFHFCYDIHTLYTKLELSPFFWFISPKIIGGSFIFIVGISLHLKFENPKNRQFSLFFKQGMKVFLCGLLITGVTWFLTYLKITPLFVVFGVLHCIGLSIIFAYPFLVFRKLNVVLGILLCLFGIYIFERPFDVPDWLYWTGVRNDSPFQTSDDYPVLRWFGVILLGIEVGRIFSRKKGWVLPIADISEKPLGRLTIWLGRHSLGFYLIHQPVLIAGVLLAKSVFK